ATCVQRSAFRSFAKLRRLQRSAVRGVTRRDNLLHRGSFVSRLRLLGHWLPWLTKRRPVRNNSTRSSSLQPSPSAAGPKPCQSEWRSSAAFRAAPRRGGTRKHLSLTSRYLPLADNPGGLSERASSSAGFRDQIRNGPAHGTDGPGLWWRRRGGGCH